MPKLSLLSPIGYLIYNFRREKKTTQVSIE